MKTLIQLTDPYGNEFYVNPNFIVTMAPVKSGAVLFISSDSNATYVKETPKEIIQKISEL